MALSLETRRKISETHKRKGTKPPIGGMTGKVQSEEAKRKIGIANKGKKNGQWKSDGNLTHSGVHMWLRKTYGTPSICEHCPKKNAAMYDWAKVIGKPYAREREHYIRLCRSCHMKYDYQDPDARQGSQVGVKRSGK